MAEPNIPEKADLLAAIRTDCAEAVRVHRRARLPSQLLRDLTAEEPCAEIDLFLASHRDTPSRILAEISERSLGKTIRIAIALHSRTPAQQLQSLADDATPAVRRSVAENASIPPRVATQLVSDSAITVRCALAANSAIPSRIQITLSEDPSPLVRSFLLKQRRLEPEVLERLRNDTDPFVKARAIITAPLDEKALLRIADAEDTFEQHCLLERKEISESVLESLAFSKHSEIQLGALERHTLSPDEMLGWARTGPAPVRCLVAAAPGVPAEIQAVLAGDAEPSVLLALAENENLDPDAALALTESSCPEVVHAVAANPAVSEPVLLALCSAEDALVPKIIAARHELPEAIRRRLGELGEDILYHLAHHGVPCPEAAAVQAETLSWHMLPTLRGLVAGVETLPADALARLARDPAPAVRHAVARNMALPDECLEALTHDDIELIADTATAERKKRREQEAREESDAANEEGLLHRLIRRVLLPRSDD